jgi:hypothetical protein
LAAEDEGLRCPQHLDWILAGREILLPSMPDMLLVVDGEPAFWILSTAIRSMSSM